MTFNLMQESILLLTNENFINTGIFRWCSLLISTHNLYTFVKELLVGDPRGIAVLFDSKFYESSLYNRSLRIIETNKGQKF